VADTRARHDIEHAVEQPSPARMTTTKTVFLPSITGERIVSSGVSISISESASRA